MLASARRPRDIDIEARDRKLANAKREGQKVSNKSKKLR